MQSITMQHKHIRHSAVLSLVSVTKVWYVLSIFHGSYIVFSSM